jgi:hypothetical protein
VTKATIYTGLRSYENGRPCEIGRIETEDCVLLVHRYTDTDHTDPWRATWIGWPHQPEAIKIPEGLLRADKLVASALGNAKIISPKDAGRR